MQATPQNLPGDADAQRALAWLGRGEPQDEIVFDDAVPRQSNTERALFHKASFKRDRG